MLFLWSNRHTQYTLKWNIPAALGAEIVHGMLFVAWETGALNPCKNEILWQLLVPKDFREYGFAFGAICALNTHEI